MKKLAPQLKDKNAKIAAVELKWSWWNNAEKIYVHKNSPAKLLFDTAEGNIILIQKEPFFFGLYFYDNTEVSQCPKNENVIHIISDLLDDHHAGYYQREIHFLKNWDPKDKLDMNKTPDPKTASTVRKWLEARDIRFTERGSCLSCKPQY